MIDYIELAVDDLERAKAFYAKALGWAFNDYGPDYAVSGSREPQPRVRRTVAADARVTRRGRPGAGAHRGRR